jgi:CheY-like chemotaxis protein
MADSLPHTTRASLDVAGVPGGRRDISHVVAAHRRRKVLLVDDNEPFAEALSGLLRVLGHDVHIAYEGSTALAALREFFPDIVLLDIALPDVSGYELARAIREDAALAGLILIAMTGYGREQDRESTKAAGIDHHLTKPLDEDALIQLITAASSRR